MRNREIESVRRQLFNEQNLNSELRKQIEELREQLDLLESEHCKKKEMVFMENKTKEQLSKEKAEVVA